MSHSLLNIFEVKDDKLQKYQNQRMFSSKQQQNDVVTSSRVSRSPKCSRCRNHGVTSDLKGHKYRCRWRQCVCMQCLVSTEHQKITADRIALFRRQTREMNRQPTKRNRSTSPVNTTPTFLEAGLPPQGSNPPKGFVYLSKLPTYSELFSGIPNKPKHHGYPEVHPEVQPKQNYPEFIDFTRYSTPTAFYHSSSQQVLEETTSPSPSPIAKTSSINKSSSLERNYPSQKLSREPLSPCVELTPKKTSSKPTLLHSIENIVSTSDHVKPHMPSKNGPCCDSLFCPMNTYYKMWRAPLRPASLVVSRKRPVAYCELIGSPYAKKRML